MKIIDSPMEKYTNDLIGVKTCFKCKELISEDKLCGYEKGKYYHLNCIKTTK